MKTFKTEKMYNVIFENFLFLFIFWTFD